MGIEYIVRSLVSDESELSRVNRSSSKGFAFAESDGQYAVFMGHFHLPRLPVVRLPHCGRLCSVDAAQLRSAEGQIRLHPESEAARLCWDDPAERI